MTKAPLSPEAQRIIDAVYETEASIDFFNIEESMLSFMRACAASALHAIARELPNTIPDIHEREYFKGIESAAGFIENIASQIECPSI